MSSEPAGVTFSVARAPASIVATAQRDNDASKRVPAFMERNLLDATRARSRDARRDPRETCLGEEVGQTRCRNPAVPRRCAWWLLTTAHARLESYRASGG